MEFIMFSKQVVAAQFIRWDVPYPHFLFLSFLWLKTPVHRNKNPRFISLKAPARLDSAFLLPAEYLPLI
jgi:hypothetical protein